MNKTRILIIVIFVAASLLRLADAFRPLDKASWRECDLGAVSRNYVQEGMNPFYPRIDWRGNGPGYAEMEFPVYPYLVAITYKIFGIHDEIGRLWAFLFSIGTLFFFYRLAREYLSKVSAAVAFTFFAFNPLVFEESTAVQPEGLMLMAYVGAVYFFVRWLKTEGIRPFGGVIVMTALALLAKASSAHMGLFFGVLLYGKYGWRTVINPKVWIFGISTILPAALWYVHAKGLWLIYGNSLGVSNEYHWIGWDFFTNPEFIKGILKSEIIYAWVVFGIIAGAFAIWKGFREETAKHALLWLASIFVFYILASRTTSDDWAYYYHVFSIPPVALIIGFCIKQLWDYAGDFAETYSRRSMPVNLSKIALMLVVTGTILLTFALEARQVRAYLLESRLPSPAFTFAKKAKPLLSPGSLILASGGHCLDPDGYQVAYNASYMFYWLGHKGWNVCVEDQSAAKIAEFRKKGAAYFVGEKKYLHETDGLEKELRQVYPVTIESDDLVIFDMNGGR